MKLITIDNYEELSKVAARELASTIKEKPNAILGLATGGSPVGMYKELIKMYQDGELDFSKIKTVNLDEYVGLNPEHEQSYRHFMNENLFNHVNININNTIVIAPVPIAQYIVFWYVSHQKSHLLSNFLYFSSDCLYSSEDQPTFNCSLNIFIRSSK